MKLIFFSLKVETNIEFMFVKYLDDFFTFSSSTTRNIFAQSTLHDNQGFLHSVLLVLYSMTIPIALPSGYHTVAVPMERCYLNVTHRS